jgi:hypothetical protein
MKVLSHNGTEIDLVKKPAKFSNHQIKGILCDKKTN